MFEYFGNIHVYCPGMGAYEPLGSFFFFRIINIQSYYPFQCSMPSFFEIGVPVLEKKISKGFLPYMGMAAILVM